MQDPWYGACTRKEKKRTETPSIGETADRTRDLQNFSLLLSQLSYSPGDPDRRFEASNIIYLMSNEPILQSPSL